MRVLRFADWVAERMKIRPVTNAELDKVKEISDRIAQTAKTKSTDYRTRKLRYISDAFSKYYDMNFVDSSIYYSPGQGGFIKAADHTMDTRFKVWANTLSGPALLKKHEARANSKSIKEPKLFATMYCAFEMYGTENNYVANTIIRYYMDRLIRQYNTTDDVIIDVFFI